MVLIEEVDMDNKRVLMDRCAIQVTDPKYEIVQHTSAEELLLTHRHMWKLKSAVELTEKVWKAEYINFSKNVVAFAKLVGDVDAYLMFNTELRIKNPVPPSPAFVQSFIMYFTGLQTDKLQYEGNDVMNNGCHVMCRHSWQF